MENQNLTLDNVKACIGFDENSGLHRSLSGLCDCWNDIEKANGATDDQAARVALDKLGEKITEMDNRR